MNLEDLGGFCTDFTCSNPMTKWNNVKLLNISFELLNKIFNFNESLQKLRYLMRKKNIFEKVVSKIRKMNDSL